MPVHYIIKHTTFIFIKSSIIIDTKKLREIPAFLSHYEEILRKPPYVDLLVHEQYFYSHYKAYQPDYRQKVHAAIEWARSNGYTPGFLSNCLFSKGV